jgi:hypothetical protein
MVHYLLLQSTKLVKIKAILGHIMIIYVSQLHPNPMAMNFIIQCKKKNTYAGVATALGN